jgi:hypothetical protein
VLLSQQGEAMTAPKVQAETARLFRAFVAGWTAARGLHPDSVNTGELLQQAWHLFRTEGKILKPKQVKGKPR